ncbi:MAG: A/G-specific adenine glycosylase [Muricauda sp.]|nr:A/G-specific adenine glycosylase [Allomuricauda sp.]MAU27079.1 A/G-specific adenine glycosylase [Allomuricauda sp.]MBC30090.1 A/G-specific adenine glycosylase [Allomuricauda sp.]|tara:strand:+ start:21706 stop:22743 length:1038 start_codon:yes stop_codon:yes gene_type:complete
MSFSEKILLWYQKNKRPLPWRKTTNPYNIWLSEIMLQQTRIAQGLPYYKKFVEEFPTVEALAASSEERILKLWQGLGYYSRARNMHATAKTIANDLGGRFPDNYADLIKLKGVGDYTASAIASICFGEPQPVVDGNVYRVLARYFAVDGPINSPKGNKYFKALAREVMHTGNIRDYNQGIMEFGALQCTPQKPNCQACPLKSGCAALQKGMVDKLPVKLKKQKIRKRFFNYLVIFDNEKNTLLEKRRGKGIWQNLYQFPLIECEKKVGPTEIRNKISEKELLEKVVSVTGFDDMPIVHKLSHQHLYTWFWRVDLGNALPEGIPWKRVPEFPVPVLIADFIKKVKF